MRESKDQKEERRRTVYRVARTHKPVVTLEPVLQWLCPRIVRLFYPRSVVEDAFALETTKLEGNVGLVLHDHFGTGGKACNVFIVLAHHAVP